MLAAVAYYAAFGSSWRTPSAGPSCRSVDEVGAEALLGDVADELDGVAHEAGVREQL